MMAEFGNDPAKIAKYRAFWDRSEVARPLVVFSMVGWFPLDEFAATRDWSTRSYVEIDMIDPDEFLPDHLRMLREGETVDDDGLRGAYPGLVAIPWLPPVLGCRLRISASNVLGEERSLSWDDALAVDFDPNGNPWYEKYLEFGRALTEASRGRFPLGHGSEIGPTDLHGVLRGHMQSLYDLVEDPERSADLLRRMGRIFVDFAEHYWSTLPRFHDGYFDSQYHLWSPGSIIRMQEDATAVFSPEIYRSLVLPVDRAIAQNFKYPFFHMHPTSLFLLDDLLSIEEIRCFEINYEDHGPSVEEMIPFYRKVQEAGRSLLIRGSLAGDDLRRIGDELTPEGLMLQILVRDLAETEPLRPLVGM